jgi:Putative restriction endonuclease
MPMGRRVTIGPEHHGRRMSLDRFDLAIGRDGRLFELSRGVIEFIDTPHPAHLSQLQSLRQELVAYRERQAGPIHSIAGAGESKVMIERFQSERHPDLSIYLNAPPNIDDVWSYWIPHVVVEVVSPA